MPGPPSPHPVTPDGRYFIVRGRLWRMSNPDLTTELREKLVRDLSVARSALRRNATQTPEDRTQARRAVDRAKVALGERGPVWWTDGSPDFNRRMAVNTPYRDWFERLRSPQDRAMRKPKKQDFPVAQIRRYLEPGPIVLVSSAHKGERDIMTLGWHMMLGFEPALVGCYIWDQNHSFSLIRASQECVINIPTADMVDAVIGVGNTHGPDTDKFAEFGLTPIDAEKVGAPLIAECYASFECKLTRGSPVDKLGLFVFECVKAHVAVSPKYPQTLHYRGDGVFMVSGQNKSYRKKFKPENL